MMKEEWYQKIEAYLSGNMSSETVVEFEAELKQNQLLQKEVELYNRLNHHIGSENMDDEVLDSQYVNDIKTFLRSEEAHALEEKLKEEQEKYQKKTTANFKKYRLAIAIAAGIVFFGVWALFSKKEISPAALYITYYTSRDLPSFVKRNDVEDVTYSMMNNFRDGNYEKVLEIFDSYKETTVAIDTTLYLYIGMSYLTLDENEKAFTSFDLVTNSNILDNSKGLWFKALAYLKMNDIENAKKTLQTIVKNPANFKFKEAKEVLELL